jgi:hypothetical protein
LSGSVPVRRPAQGEASGPLEPGDDLEFGIGAGLGEDVSRTQEWCWPRWTWWKTPTKGGYACQSQRGGPPDDFDPRPAYRLSRRGPGRAVSGPRCGQLCVPGRRPAGPRLRAGRLRAAYLTGVNLSPEQIEKAITDAVTVPPDRTVPGGPDHSTDGSVEVRNCSDSARLSLAGIRPHGRALSASAPPPRALDRAVPRLLLTPVGAAGPPW